jgi:phytoene dehydrogenase-like protein
VLALAGHDAGWPLVAGGTERLTEALAAYLRALGGEIEVGAPVRTLRELPPSRLVFLDVTPRQFLAMAGDQLSERQRRRLAGYRYGPGVFKVDWALSAPVPWRDPACARAGTVHLGGPLAHIVADEAAVWRGEHPERPFVLLAQPTVADPSRAPAGRHVLWGYCHVPNGSTVDMTERIERRIEEFAPGFRDVVLARHVMAPQALEAYNANYVGGDIAGGSNMLRQLVFRPLPTLSPYATPLDGVYLCSSSTPPGGGVHGMCGWHAVQAAVGEGR